MESPHQVEMKDVVKSSKYFLGYFNTLETHSDAPLPINKCTIMCFFSSYFYPVEIDIPYQTNKKSLWQLQGMFHSNVSAQITKLWNDNRNKNKQISLAYCKHMYYVMYYWSLYFSLQVKKETVLNGIFLTVSLNLSAHSTQ